jgi:hypothetical protein
MSDTRRVASFTSWGDRLIPESILADADSARRARTLVMVVCVSVLIGLSMSAVHFANGETTRGLFGRRRIKRGFRALRR